MHRLKSLISGFKQAPKKCAMRVKERIMIVMRKVFIRERTFKLYHNLGWTNFDELQVNSYLISGYMLAIAGYNEL